MWTLNSIRIKREESVPQSQTTQDWFWPHTFIALCPWPWASYFTTEKSKVNIVWIIIKQKKKKLSGNPEVNEKVAGPRLKGTAQVTLPWLLSLSSCWNRNPRGDSPLFCSLLAHRPELCLAQSRHPVKVCCQIKYLFVCYLEGFYSPVNALQ